jgi:hypothetical protein
LKNQGKKIMLQSNDATAAYRGYRLQALYALFRILDQNGDNRLIFQPEVLEDLSIQDEKGNLLEVIQVKSGHLTLSSFKESFFIRINSLIKSQNPPRIVVASFSDVGPELLQAIKKEGPERERVAKKLKAKYKIIHSREEAKILLEHLELKYLNELELKEIVYGHLKNSLIGMDPESAFDLLNFWLYIYSEKKHAIAKSDIIKKIENIGKFLAARAAYHDEWFRSIKPIDDLQIDSEKSSKLYEEFYHGISARYDHILSNTDALRPTKIQEITVKFKESRVVIIHGASGQGKTTLAYRYLHDYFPNMWRFEVELIENRLHANNIACAIIGHADAIGIPIAIFIDVSAKDLDWPVLVEQLAYHQNIRILVSIREEDYRRSSIQDFKIQFRDIDLAFDIFEAQEIYRSLEETMISRQFLSFEEAWKAFGGGGPLMEFVYLVTQGESLQKRLKEQVVRLEDESRHGEIEPGEIELLRLVSVASAYNARFKIEQLIDCLKLAAPRRTFELFEKEYLLRLSTDGSLVSGLHPIRSEILVDLLTDPVITPWSECAIMSLPYIFELDIENFLLHAFSRRRNDIESILAALNSWQPDRWAAIGGIIRALIWLGVLEYTEENQGLIQDLFNDVGTGFVWLLDSDISNAMPGIASSSLDSFCSLGLINEENRQKIASGRARQTDKAHIFMRARLWLSSRCSQIKVPQCNEDWSGVAESSFWLGYLGIAFPLSEQISHFDLERAIAYLPLEILADLIMGLSYGFGKDFAAWLTSNSTALINRFRDETLTVNLQDEKQKAIVHYIVDFEKIVDPNLGQYAGEKPGSILHDEAMRRIRLLRGILPDRDTYACQGYGHQLLGQELPLDETRKTGIPISQLPPRWLININSVFRGLAEQPHRPKTWNEYAKSIFDLRKQILNAMEYLESGLKAYFQKEKPDQLFGKLIAVEQWYQYQQMLSRSPLIPSCAVDEWGFVDEFGLMPMGENKNSTIRGFALQKHEMFLIYFNKYIKYLTNFLNQSSHAMVLCPIRGKAIKEGARRREADQRAIKSGIKSNFISLSVINLSDCAKALPTFQIKFKQTLGRFFEISELEDLEKRELIAFYRVWCMWYFFSTDPNLTHRNPEKKYVTSVDKMIIDIKKNIQKRLSALSSERLSISIASYDLLFEDKTAIWISIDGDNGLDVFNSLEKIAPEVFNSINGFRDKDLARRAFGMMWPLIIIIPKIKGNCLTDKVWKVDSNTLLWATNDGKLNWWNYAIQYSLPRNILSELNINIWDIPQIEIAARLFQNTFRLSAQLDSIRDLERLPKLDDRGIKQVEIYFQKSIDEIIKVWQNVVDSANNMVAIYTELPNLNDCCHTNMIESINALNVLCKYMPEFDAQGKITIELSTVSKWADMLDEGGSVPNIL